MTLQSAGKTEQSRFLAAIASPPPQSCLPRATVLVCRLYLEHAQGLASAGIGFGLTSALFSPWFSHSSTGPEPSHATTPRKSFLSAFVASQVFQHPAFPVLTSLPPIPPSPDIKVLSARRFLCKTKETNITLLRFHDQYSPTFINSINSDPPPPPEPPPESPSPQPPPDFYNAIPKKYWPWAYTVFNPSKFEKLPPHRPYDVNIKLEDGKTPPFGPIYQLSLTEREAVAEYVNSNLKRGHIRRSTSSAGAPVLFTRKKTGKIRLCVDFRGLNAITKKNRYPLPLVDDLLNRVQGCKVFTVINLKSAYSHLCIKEGDEWKTAFRTHLGLFEHLVVPYGLTNAPAAFQSFIQDTLRNILDIVCVVYIDDILIFSKTQEEHDQHVAMVLDRLRNAGLCANAAKCEFDKSEVEYLGFILSADGIKMNPKKLDTIASWPEPTTVKDLQRFLGFTNFYRRFIEAYSRLTLPLTKLTKKSNPWDWSKLAQAAFQELKSNS